MTQTAFSGGFTICRKSLPLGPIELQLMSDLHIGSSMCNLNAINAELADAKANGRRVLINGDVVDAILPKDSKRFQPGALHPDLARRDDVLNATLDMVADILNPYADIIDMVGTGNHDNAVTRWHACDPLPFIVDRLRAARTDKDHTVHHAGYQGYMSYTMRGDGGGCHTLVIYFNHGRGGDAPVTKGMIDFSRLQSAYNADVYWVGHKHNRFVDHDVVVRCPKQGEHPVIDPVVRVMTGAYLNAHEGQSQGDIEKYGRRTNYAADMGYGPKPTGGAVLRCSPVRDNRAGQSRRLFKIQAVT